MRTKKSINYQLIQYQILQNNIIRIIWQTVRRIANEIFRVKGLISLTLFQRLDNQVHNCKMDYLWFMVYSFHCMKCLQQSNNPPPPTQHFISETSLMICQYPFGYNFLCRRAGIRAKLCWVLSQFDSKLTKKKKPLCKLNFTLSPSQANLFTPMGNYHQAITSPTSEWDKLRQNQFSGW